MSLSVTLYLADQNPERDRSLGITRATRAIADQIHRDVRLTQVVSSSSVQLGSDLVAGTVRLPLPTDHGPARLAGDLLHPALARTDADVWFYPKGYITSPLPLGAPTLALVHDTILDHYAQHHPGDRSRLALAFWLGQLRTTLRRATRVATISQTARRQILDFCDRSGIAPPPIDVIYATTAFEQTAPAQAASPFALHLGAGAPHKRTAWLIHAWTSLVVAGRDLPPLHVVGTVPEAARAAFEALPHAVAHGRVSDAELVRLYREASVVVVPSEIEGFGLPILEAYASGTPVVFTAGTSMEEVAQAGTAVGGFDLAAPETLAHAIDEALALSDDEIRAIQGALRDAFSPGRLRQRVVGALHAAAGRDRPATRSRVPPTPALPVPA